MAFHVRPNAACDFRRRVDRVNLAGQVTAGWPLPDAVGPLLLTTGFGLDIWVADSAGRKLYKLTPYAVGN
jgi:hypothetical protein